MVSKQTQQNANSTVILNPKYKTGDVVYFYSKLFDFGGIVTISKIDLSETILKIVKYTCIEYLDDSLILEYDIVCKVDETIGRLLYE